MVPTYHTVSFGLVPKCLHTSIWALSSAHSLSQRIILQDSHLHPNACIQEYEHFPVLVHVPNSWYCKFQICAQILVYLHLSSCQWSFMFQTYHPSYQFRTCAQMLVYKHLSTCQCSFMVPIYYTRSFGFVPNCLYTSIWSLFILIHRPNILY